jgi:hypothetical protein
MGCLPKDDGSIVAKSSEIGKLHCMYIEVGGYQPSFVNLYSWLANLHVWHKRITLVLLLCPA